jgi:hypothetical protein
MSVIHNDLAVRECDFRKQNFHTIGDGQLLPLQFNFNFLLTVNLVYFFASGTTVERMEAW